MQLLKFISMRWWLLITVGTGACKTSAPGSSDVDINSYQEDITMLRESWVSGMDEALDTLRDQTMATNANLEPTEPVPATHDHTAEINALMDSIAAFYGQRPAVDGYTILVYSGTNREAATLAQREVQQLGLSPKFEYARPSFKVKVGRYTDELEARRTHLLLKRHFRSAIIVPERIILR